MTDGKAENGVRQRLDDRASDPGFWRFKASALLLPTPLVWVDPDGECERAAIVAAALGPNPEADARCLEQCHRDAALAQRGSAAATGASGLQGTSAPLASLKHPLDPTSEGPRPTHADLQTQWKDHWHEVQRHAENAKNSVTYRTRWRAFVGAETNGKALCELVHDPSRPDYTVLAHRSLAAAFAGARYGGGCPALLLLQVGPVQVFIEASRRTHDLWGGSYLISTLAFAGLRCIADALGPDAILTPWPAELELAEHHLFHREWSSDEDRRLARMQPSLPAKLMALVPNELADEVAMRAQEAIQN